MGTEVLGTEVVLTALPEVESEGTEGVDDKDGGGNKEGGAGTPPTGENMQTEDKKEDKVHEDALKDVEDMQEDVDKHEGEGGCGSDAIHVTRTNTQSSVMRMSWTNASQMTPGRRWRR